MNKMEISDKDRSFYEKMQTSFKTLLNSESSITEVKMKEFIQNTIDDMKKEGVDIQKIVLLCSIDPDSVLKIQPFNSTNNQIGPSAENYTLPDDETPEAVCVYKKL